MLGRLGCWALLTAFGLGAAIIPDVRAAIARKDWATARKLIQDYRAQHGVTPEMLEALSWMGRGALQAGNHQEADEYAAETRRLALDLLKGRELDAEPHLPIALGASIEVQAQVMAARNQRAEALEFLQQELAAWGRTSIRTRIQKNINLLSLEGKPAPALEMQEWVGAKPLPQAQWNGRVVLLFFWAHWCRDCRQQAPVLARLQQEFGPRGLLLIAPTQRYGFTTRGRQAGPGEERAYIEKILREHFAALGDLPGPLSEENFRVYGASTTPTLVLVDRRGIVRLYHPGQMSYEELAPRVAHLIGGS